MQFDTVIKNGLIVDGARNPRWRGDIGIKDGVITRMGKIGHTGTARVIDATGLVVAPGFIDLHTHYDAQIYWDPYLSTSGFHGVTSVVIGNCGFGFAPMTPETRERAMQSMTRVEAIPLATLKAALPWDWVSYPEYLDSMDRVPKALNILPYVPVNPILICRWALPRPNPAACPPRPSTRRSRNSCTRPWMPVPAAGPRSAWARPAVRTSPRRAVRRRSISTARPCRAT